MVLSDKNLTFDLLCTSKDPDKESDLQRRFYSARKLAALTQDQLTKYERAIAKAMLERKMDVESIASLTGMSVEDIQALK